VRAALLVLLAAVPAWAGGALSVVTTSTDLQALVEAVGGDRVRVESLAPAAHEPHAVEITPGQFEKLKAAALLVRIGLDHEPWLARVLRAANDPRFAPGSAYDLDVSKSVDLLQTATARVRGEGVAHVHGFGNPHYWLDPANARPMTGAILEALVRLAPDGRDVFAKNRARWLARLDDALARWTRALAPYRGRSPAGHGRWRPIAARAPSSCTTAGRTSPDASGSSSSPRSSPRPACPRRRRRSLRSPRRCARRGSGS